MFRNERKGAGGLGQLAAVALVMLGYLGAGGLAIRQYVAAPKPPAQCVCPVPSAPSGEATAFN